jgi:hypothetical protein
MTIPLQISPRIIPNVASLYNDVNRIFMEYIDNSIDSAETFYNDKSRKYSRPLEITLEIHGDNYRDGKVIIYDNCFGITNFTKVVQSIGNSDKRADFTTNGQFGYGIYSFMASCSKLELTSKTENENAKYLPIEKHQFDTDKQEDVSFPNPKTIKFFEFASGTKICLSEFDKHNWKQINISELQNEVEKHFEILLSRKNLTIRLIRINSRLLHDKEEYVCKPFDYDQYEGEIWEDYQSDLTFKDGRRYPEQRKLTTKKPLHVFIKITKGKEINKRPIFICKGRRIGEVKDIKSFKSNHKSELWDHPNVTGYIDLSDFLDPTIARTDFRNNVQSKALFSYLINVEPLILDVIREVNKTSEERHYQQLEDRLNQALSKLARLDAMNYRTDLLSGNDINLLKGGTGQDIENGNGAKDKGNSTIDSISERELGENEGFGKGIGGNSGNIPGGDDDGDFALNKEADNPFEDTGFKGGEKKKAGFNIRIVDTEPPVDSADIILRSTLAGSEIRIFKQHPDFQERVDMSRRGETRITQRLITYLAGEITVHYKDKFHTKQKEQPEYNKTMFTDLVGFVYQFEAMLKDLAGKNLSDLGN